jgi:hypothetical protein
MEYKYCSRKFERYNERSLWNYWVMLKYMRNLLPTVSNWDNYEELHFMQDGAPTCDLTINLVVGGLAAKSNGMVSAKSHYYLMWYFFVGLRQRKVPKIEPKNIWWNWKTNSWKVTAVPLDFLRKTNESVSSMMQKGVQNTGGTHWKLRLRSSVWALKWARIVAIYHSV